MTWLFTGSSVGVGSRVVQFTRLRAVSERLSGAGLWRISFIARCGFVPNWDFGGKFGGGGVDVSSMDPAPDPGVLGCAGGPVSVPVDPDTSARSTTPTGGARSTRPTGGVRSTTPTGGVRPTTPTGGVRPTTPTGGVRSTTPTGGVRPTTPTGGVRPTTPTGGCWSQLQWIQDQTQQQRNVSLDQNPTLGGSQASGLSSV